MGSDGDRGQVTLRIKLASDGSAKSVQTDLSQTVEDFKRFLAHLTGVPSDQQLLVYMGRYLDNPRKLASYGMEPNQTVHLVQCSAKQTMHLSGTCALDGTSGSEKKTQSASKVVGESLSHENHRADIEQFISDFLDDESALISSREFGSIDILDEMADESFCHENHKVRVSMQDALFGCATAAVCGCNSTSRYHSVPGDNGLSSIDSIQLFMILFA